jgi:hypothetical protein
MKLLVKLKTVVSDMVVEPHFVAPAPLQSINEKQNEAV